MGEVSGRVKKNPHVPLLLRNKDVDFSEVRFVVAVKINTSGSLRRLDQGAAITLVAFKGCSGQYCQDVLSARFMEFPCILYSCGQTVAFKPL